MAPQSGGIGAAVRVRCRNSVITNPPMRLRWFSQALTTCALAALAGGCGQDPLSASERTQLREARALWVSKGGADYTVESRVQCFCPPQLNFWTKIVVKGGKVVSTEPVEALPVGVTPSLVGWSTVDEVFDRALTRDKIITTIRVRFDKTLGYPLEVSLACASTVTDCGVTYGMRNLTIP